jgi:hypothetical protein
MAVMAGAAALAAIGSKDRAVTANAAAQRPTHRPLSALIERFLQARPRFKARAEPTPKPR